MLQFKLCVMFFDNETHISEGNKVTFNVKDHLQYELWNVEQCNYNKE